MNEHEYEYDLELQLAGGEVVSWRGRDGERAARSYADAHPGVTVVAWRWPGWHLGIGLHSGCIVEPAPGLGRTA